MQKEIKTSDNRLLLKNLEFETNKINIMNKVMKIQNPLIRKSNVQLIETFFRENL